jgi:hypothetical protein
MENDDEKGSDVRMETVSNSNTSKLGHPNGNLEDQDDFKFTFGKFMACWVSTAQPPP